MYSGTSLNSFGGTKYSCPGEKVLERSGRSLITSRGPVVKIFGKLEESPYFSEPEELDEEW